MYKTTVPINILRKGFDYEQTLSTLKRMKADRAAMLVEVKMPETDFKVLADAIRDYEENGIETMIWIGETMGHSPEKKENPYGYTNLRLIDKGETGSYCPLDKNFINDLCTFVKKLIGSGAKMIMLDDDFRLSYRGSLGCCCDLHMEKLEAELGEKIERESLREKIFSGGANKYRDAWFKVQGESMYALARALRKAADEVDASVRLGRCCSLNAWDSDGNDVVEMAYAFAGNTKPFIRLSGAPYWCCRDRYHKLGVLTEYVRMEMNWCRDKGVEMFSEGDTWPRPRFATPASYLECFDTILRADGTNDGILKYVIDYSAGCDYETGFVDAAVKNKTLYKDIDKLFSDTNAVGVRPYNAMHIIKDAVYNADEDNLLNKIQDGVFSKEVQLAVENSLPVSYEPGGVNIVFGESCRHIPLEDLKYGNIIDIDGARILSERGVDTGILNIREDKTQNVHTYYACKQYFIEEDRYIAMRGAVKLPFTDLKEGAVVHTRFGEKNGITEYTNKNGESFLILPFSALDVDGYSMGYFMNYSLKRLLTGYINRTKSKLLAWCDKNYTELYLMTKANDKALSVGLWNLFADSIDNAQIELSVEFDSIEFVNCTGHTDGNKVILDKTLYPYEFAGFKVKLR